MSGEMLALAAAKKCYRVTKLNVVSPNCAAKLISVDYLYDAMLLCSSFQPGHISPNSLEKLAAQLADLGHIVWCSRSLSVDQKAGTAFADQSFQVRANACGSNTEFLRTVSRIT